MTMQKNINVAMFSGFCFPGHCPYGQNWPKEDVDLINGRLIMVHYHSADVYLKVQIAINQGGKRIIKSV